MIWLTCARRAFVKPEAQRNTFGHGTGSRLQLRSAPHPLVDGPVLAAVDRLLDVELPHGRAGVEVVVVEHAVDGDVLAGPHHHLLRDVADGCGATTGARRDSLVPTLSIETDFCSRI